MTDNVVLLPVPRTPRTAGVDRAATLAEAMCIRYAGENPDEVVDAMVRNIAGIINANAVNRTDAIEAAQSIGRDLETVTRAMTMTDAEAEALAAETNRQLQSTVDALPAFSETADPGDSV